MPKGEPLTPRQLADEIADTLATSKMPFDDYTVTDATGNEIRSLVWDHDNRRLVLSDAG